MLTISVTSLAQLAKEDACERCFWLNDRLKGRWPQSHFPGVFTHLDRAGKLALAQWVSEKHQTPPWLAKFGQIERLIKPPHWSKFNFTHGDLQVRGEADVIAVLESGGLFIPDLKTAMFTAKQEEVLPIYAAQVNCYGLAAEAQGLGTVEKLAIAYLQPQPDGQADDMIRDGGFAVYFSALAFGVDRNDERIFELCNRAKEILSSDIPLLSSTCAECQKLGNLINVVQTGVIPQ